MPLKPECKKIPDAVVICKSSSSTVSRKTQNTQNLRASWLKVARTNSEKTLSQKQGRRREPDFSKIILLGRVSTYARAHAHTHELKL